MSNSDSTHPGATDDEPLDEAPAPEPAATGARTRAAAILEEAQDELARTFETIAEFWGFTRTQGRIFGLLFLSPQPLDHGTIRRRLEISAGSTSGTLAALLDWGVVHREGRLYRAETDLWKLITDVFRRREREKVEEAIERVARAVRLLDSAPDADPHIAFARERLAYLQDFFALGRALLNAVVGQNAVRGILNSLARRAAKLRRVSRLAASLGRSKTPSNSARKRTAPGTPQGSPKTPPKSPLRHGHIGFGS